MSVPIIRFSSGHGPCRAVPSSSSGRSVCLLYARPHRDPIVFDRTVAVWSDTRSVIGSRRSSNGTFCPWYDRTTTIPRKNMVGSSWEMRKMIGSTDFSFRVLSTSAPFQSPIVDNSTRSPRSLHSSISNTFSVSVLLIVLAVFTLSPNSHLLLLPPYPFLRPLLFRPLSY